MPVPSSPLTGPEAFALARTVLDRAVRHAVRSQQPDGSWSSLPDARVLETAAVTVLLAPSPLRLPDGVLERARRRLPSLPRQRHDTSVTAAEEWLVGLALGDRRLPPLPAGGAGTTPSGRELLYMLLAVAAGLPGARPEALAATARSTLAALDGQPVKPWQRVMLLAGEVVGASRSGGPVPAGSAEVLAGAVRESGAAWLMPVVAAAAHLALAHLPGGVPHGERLLAGLAHAQEADGTWRFMPFDVWDTALMVRSLRGARSFDRCALDPAVAFLSTAQNPDGGWGAHRGLDSDADTTGTVLLALADGHAAAARVATAARVAAAARAVEWARAWQQPDGLWRTWLSADDTVRAQDVVAHLVAGLAAHDADVDTTRAREWLTACQGEGGWRSQWYSPPAYATAEIGAALGPDHPATRAAAVGLAAAQHPDGGWPAHPGGDSSPAATGPALSALSRVPGACPPDVLHRAVGYLAATQDEAGTWPGTPVMAGPRPFLVHYPTHTHAFAGQGLRDLLHTAGADGRRRATGSDLARIVRPPEGAVPTSRPTSTEGTALGGARPGGTS
ncbi:prenyltransferase/squalene oxidase repeat-containing protein [Streptomyces sp. NPDC012421]|uniref:prenyltransferase/squalene oxidase repeat-containing protein n=1 Tax=Streptomyces sp. NPDC012421 TaxID=3364832 RepID=UPI0036E5DCFC